jgi:hypothetical protein
MSSSLIGGKISTILRHDNKQTSYKIALLRSINDVVLNFPDLAETNRDIAIPLLLLADFWIAYYWVFVDAEYPIYQGPRAKLDGELRNDMAFRPELEELRHAFQQVHGDSRPSDGFFLINELRMSRKRDTLPEPLLDAYQDARKSVARTLRMPIKYAGPGHWEVFPKPRRLYELGDDIAAVPGTKSTQSCLVVRRDLWNSFQRLSLWVEALCVHEWCLFTESVDQPDGRYDRGDIFALLTSRPDNRVSLTWERNHIDILLMEGERFTCPWTGKTIGRGVGYNLDHLLPVSVYPINELWNLVPSDPHFNQHKKRDRIPSPTALSKAHPRIVRAYDQYQKQSELNHAFKDDLSTRFATVDVDAPSLSQEAANAVTSLIDQIGTYRNLSRFEL